MLGRGDGQSTLVGVYPLGEILRSISAKFVIGFAALESAYFVWQCCVAVTRDYGSHQTPYSCWQEKEVACFHYAAAKRKMQNKLDQKSKHVLKKGTKVKMPNTKSSYLPIAGPSGSKFDIVVERVLRNSGL